MNKIYYPLIVSMLFSLSATSQNAFTTTPQALKKWQKKHLTFGLGADWAEYKATSLEGMLSYAEDPIQLRRDLRNLEEESTTSTAGLALYIGVSLSPLDISNKTYKQNQELRLGMTLYAPKEAMLSYKNQDLDTSIVYCNIHGAVALEGVYLFTGKWGKRWIWSIGIGTDLGLSFGNEMVLMSGKYFEPGAHPSEQEKLTEERYAAKSVSYLRGFIPYGLHYEVTRNLAIGLEGRKARGLQMIAGEKSRFMKKSGALVLSIKYRLG